MQISTEHLLVIPSVALYLKRPLAFQNLHISKHLRVKNSFGEMLEEQIYPEVISTT